MFIKKEGVEIFCSERFSNSSSFIQNKARYVSPFDRTIFLVLFFSLLWFAFVYLPPKIIAAISMLLWLNSLSLGIVMHFTNLVSKTFFGFYYLDKSYLISSQSFHFFQCFAVFYNIQKQSPGDVYKIDILKNFTKFTENFRKFVGLFFNKFVRWRFQNCNHVY